MSEDVFSQYTLTILKNAGWHPDRFVDISTYVQSLQADGYVVFASVRDFLANFGGLVINWSTVDKMRSITHQIHFDASIATNEVYPAQVAEYAEKIGTPLCVIGESDRQNVTLMMDKQGRVYAGVDHFLWLDGENCWQAIENIITEKNIKQLFPVTTE